ncbi:MAG TPA: hypothetical protein VLX92_25065 [Kofleriaceae bacterium]|nr:hypothetical protein [Kofleriaceae bacterium]
MQDLDLEQLARVHGGESFGDVMGALHALPDVPVSQTYAQTTDFIRDHPFFHRGVMDLPIGGGKHFRNVPFVGPSRILGGALHGNLTAIQKGAEVTRATWDAP